MRISDWSADVCSSDLQSTRWCVTVHRPGSRLAPTAAPGDPDGIRRDRRRVTRRTRRRACRRLLLLRHVQVGDGAVVGLGGHAHRFAEGGMRVDGVADVGDLAAHLDRQCGLGDQVAGVHADDAGANDALRGLVEYQLGEALGAPQRSEEHTSELQSLMRNSYAVFCLKKKIIYKHSTYDKSQ